MVFSRIASFFGAGKKHADQDVYSDYDVSDYINEIVRLVTEGFTHVNKRIDSVSSFSSNNFSMMKSLSERHDAEISQILARISDLSEDVSSLRDEIGKIKKELRNIGDGTKPLHKKHENTMHGACGNNVTTPATDVVTMLPHHVATVKIKHDHGKPHIDPKEIAKTLPPALLPVFNELLNAEKFLSYKELAHRIGKKESTARAYVNELRNRGVSIEEKTSANGMKLIRLAKHIRQEYMIPE